MTTRTARLFVLMTSLLAFSAICAAGALSLRLLRTKASISALMADDQCPNLSTKANAGR